MKCPSPDISVIILTFNEEKQIERCITSAKDIVSNTFIIDSDSSDNTINIAESLRATCIRHSWEGNQAQQFNWGLENLPIKTEWVLRLDADEYLLPELVEEIKNKLHAIPQNVNGVIFKRRHIFFNKWMKRGIYPVKLLRLFRYKKAICEQRWMDEHIVLLEGKSVEFDNDFVDHNLNNLSRWIQKHNGYSIREAIVLLDIELNLINSSSVKGQLHEQAEAKRSKKKKYIKQPLFLRSFLYFIYRYIFKLGFLEGKEGFLWHFLQGWWYRTLVDAKIYEIKKSCGTDKEKIKNYLKEQYSIEI